VKKRLRCSGFLVEHGVLGRAGVHPSETALIGAIPAENRVPEHGGILFRPKIARKPAADRVAEMLWHQTPGNPEGHQAAF
jgi:hypothetical protein